MSSRRVINRQEYNFYGDSNRHRDVEYYGSHKRHYSSRKRHHRASRGSRSPYHRTKRLTCRDSTDSDADSRRSPSARARAGTTSWYFRTRGSSRVRRLARFFLWQTRIRDRGGRILACLSLSPLFLHLSLSLCFSLLFSSLSRVRLFLAPSASTTKPDPLLLSREKSV